MSPTLAFSILGAVCSVPVLILIYEIFKPFFHPDHVYIIRVSPTRGVLKKFMKYDKAGFVFKGAKVKYIPDPDCAYASGRFNTKTFYYLLGKAEPVNFQTFGLSSKISDTEHHAATESHALSEVLTAFSNPISLMTATLIIAIVVILGSGAIWYKTGKIESQLKPIAIAVGVVTPEPKAK